MYKIAVLGDRESVCGFACLGVEAVAVKGFQEAKAQFSRLVKDNYGIIYITEYYAEALKEEIALLESSVTPAVILIPGVRGNTGEAMKSISRTVERAVGSLILD